MEFNYIDNNRGVTNLRHHDFEAYAGIFNFNLSTLTTLVGCCTQMGHGQSYLGYHFGLGPPMKTQEKVLGWDVVMPRGVVGFEPLNLGH